MSNNVVNISNAIKTKLQSVGQLNDVYEYVPDKPTDGKYPYATITWNGAPVASFGDTMRNLRTYSFLVDVYQERTKAGFGNAKADRVVREIADEIFTAFDMDTTLSGMVKKVDPIRCSTEYDDREVGDIRVAEIRKHL